MPRRPASKESETKNLATSLIPNLIAYLGAANEPATLYAEDVARKLGCTVDDIKLLVNAGLLKPLGDAKRSTVKRFHKFEVISLSMDRQWMSDVWAVLQRHNRDRGLKQKESKATRNADPNQGTK